MSQTLNINNFAPTNLLQQTRLTALTTAGISSLPCQDNNGFSASDFIAVGQLGSDLTELLSIAGISGSNMISLSSPTIFDHAAYDFVNKLFGDEIKIYRATNVTGLQPDDADFNSIATVSIQIDRAYTQYTDADGGDGFWYKFIYWNSILASGTSLSDSKSVRGGSSGDYCSIDNIREEAGFKYAPYVTDGMIDRKRQAAQQEINGTLVGFYMVPFIVPINPFIADICTRLAAGLLLVEQYSQTNTQNTADGQKKVDEARADLKALATKQVELIDTAGNSTAGAGSTGGISGWPNADTATTDTASGGAPRVFRMGDIQGQQGVDSSGNPVGNLYYGRKW